MMKTRNKNKTLDALQDARLSLLDPDSSDQLLHFDSTRENCLRLVNEMPDRLVARLLAGQELCLVPVPVPDRDALLEYGGLRIAGAGKTEFPLNDQPEAMEWAAYLGLVRPVARPWTIAPANETVPANTEIDSALPEAESSENPQVENPTIQTLHFPHELTERLHILSQGAESAMEEIGANCLYMAFGFLEWFAAESEAPALAPLLLLPVMLHHTSAHDETICPTCTVSATGENALYNLRLWEKLHTDFGINLPRPSGPLQPVRYCREISALLADKQAQWTVRPFITLALFNTQGMLLYRDLDPERWPDRKALARHPLVRTLLQYHADDEAGRDTQETIGDEKKNKEPDTDLIIEPPSLPFVALADGAQYKALVDALAGKNLVIEGAPGTGKSQTIANLIAAALSMDKKVLFVAEKRTALEVVRRRLEPSGLGLFCLDLYGEKLTKNHVYEAIKNRLERYGHYRSFEEIDAEKTLYVQEREKLGHYAELMTHIWRNTEESIERIFKSAVRCREEFQSFVQSDLTIKELHPLNLDGESLNPTKRAFLEEEIAVFLQGYEKTVCHLSEETGLQKHPWYGVGPIEFNPASSSQIQQALSDWQRDLRKLEHVYNQILEQLGVPDQHTKDGLYAIVSLQKELAQVPSLQGREALDLLPKLKGEWLKRCRDYQQFFERILSGYADLARVLPPSVMQDLAMAPKYLEGCKKLLKLVVNHHSLTTLSRGVKSLVDLQRELAEMQSLMQEFGQKMGPGAARHLLVTKEGLADFRDCIFLATMLPEQYWEMRHPRFDQREIDVFLSRLSDDLRGLKLLQESLQDYFRLDTLPDKYELRRLRVRLEQGGPIRRLKPSWQEDRKLLLALAVDPENVQYGKMFDLLPLAEEFAVKVRELVENWKYHDLLGEHMRGLDTDMQTLGLLRSWYQAVRNRFGYEEEPKAEFGDILLNLPIETLQELRELHERAVPQKIDALLEGLLQLQEVFPPLLPLQGTDLLLHEGKGPVASFIHSLLRAVRACQPIVVDTGMTVAELHKLGQRLVRLYEAVTVWERSNPDAQFFEGRFNLNPRAGSQNSADLATLRNTLNIASYLEDQNRDPIIRRYLNEHLKTGFAKMHSYAARLNSALQAERAGFTAFYEMTKLDSEAWMQQTNGRLSLILLRNARALQRIDKLPSWLDYASGRNRVIQAGLTWLPPMMEQAKLLPDQVMLAHQAGIYDLLEKEIVEHSPELMPFSGKRQDVLHQEMERCAMREKELRFERIAWRLDQAHVPPGKENVSEDALTDLALLRHSCNDEQEKPTLDHLFQHAATAIQALHPCFMMSPMSVAQYLEPGALRFDLVITDESSQLSLPKTLGAIARGAQLVVAGDPKQLPPLHFFTPPDTAPEDQVNEKVDSLLDAALATLPVHRLPYHYRSRYEELITFANQHFYDNRLLAGPQCLPVPADYAIRWHKIEQEWAGGRENRKEAAWIARAAREHLCSSPEDSLGIIAMSSEQRRLIAESLENLAWQDDLFRERLERDKQGMEPLLVKSLEHMQGDARDIIFISLTCESSAYQEHAIPHLGLLGSEQGERYLNVMLTRSRKRMHIFSSVDSADILATPGGSQGVQLLYQFLSRYEGNYPRKTASVLAAALEA